MFPIAAAAVMVLALSSSARADGEESWEGDKGSVEMLTDSNWDDFRTENPKMLTMFYAPWCGHCKALKPDFAKASTELDSMFDGKDTKVVVSAVDCTKETEVCKKFDVQGYPTLYYFDDADDDGSKYEEGRTKKDLVSYMAKKVDPEWVPPPPPPFVNEEVWKDEDHGNGEVLHTTDEHFEDIRKKTKHLFVMFYAPWCGHCKNLKPHWVEASTSVSRSFTFAAHDCTTSSATCTAMGASGYPTVKYLTPPVEGAKAGLSSSAQGEDYQGGGRQASDLIWFANDKIDKEARAAAKNVDKNTDFKKMKMKTLKKILKDRGEKCQGCTDKGDYIKKILEVIDKPVKKKEKRKMTMMEEKRYKEAKAAADKGWSEEEHGNGEVAHVVDQEFDDYRKANAPMLTFFYAPWCGHCKNLKPDVVKLSNQLKEEDLGAKLVAVDCTANPAVCTKYGAKSYPTIKWFNSKESATAEEVEGARDKAGMLEYIKKKLDPDYVPPPPPPWEDKKEWADEDHGNGEVLHLTDGHFDEQRAAQAPQMLTMFYAPWCGHCKAMKPDFAKASTEAKAAGVVFSAVDCTVHKKVCAKYGVQSYPTVKSFASATADAKDYEGGRTEAALVKFAEDFAKEAGGESEIEIDHDDL